MKQTYADGYPVLGTHQEIGIAQFMPRTFYSNAKKMGLSNPNILDPIQQIEVMSWMFSHNQQSQWTCH